MKLDIGPTGAWQNADNRGHKFDAGLAAALVAFLSQSGGAVLDVGCGDGSYVRYLRDAGLECCGYDGNPHTETITGGLCGVMDFSRPALLERTFGWVISLEVGEHIPAECERVFIQNLHRLNTRGVVLSWAVPGQGGAGHVNERSNDYIKGYFAALGYLNLARSENKLRSAVTGCSWFRDTLMVFRKVN